MKRDLKRHELLKILSANRVKFEANKLNDEILGTSFDDLLKLMKCDLLELNLIASELYDNNEIKHHNAYDTNGIYCEKGGMTAFSNNKYKDRFWKNYWNKIFIISQIIVPTLALIIALVTVTDSRHNKVKIEEIQLLRKEFYKLQETQDSQTNTISIPQNTLKSDSLSEKSNDK